MSRGAILSRGVADTLYADREVLLAWFAAAPAGGAWVRFALGHALDGAHPAAAQVAEWVGAGTAERRERASGGQISFEIRRGPTPAAAGSGSVLPAAQGAGGRKAGARPGAAGRADRTGDAMVALLAEAAARGEPRPSYRAMAAMLGLRDRMAARHLYLRLLRRGRVPDAGSGIDSG